MSSDNGTIGAVIIVSFMLLTICYCIRRQCIIRKLSELESLKANSDVIVTTNGEWA
jgi:hypothetical protein